MHIGVRPFAAGLALMAVLAAAGCTQSSTSVAQPSSSKCQITATNQPATYPSAGGRGSVSIGAGALALGVLLAAGSAIRALRRLRAA